MRLADVPAYGPGYKFGDAHIYYFLTMLDKDRPVSRHDLSEAMGIGEGSIRNITDIVKNWGAVIIGRTGIRISEQGEQLMQSIPINMADVSTSKYAIGKYQQGVIVHGAADKISDGMRQRDRGMISGAEGASVFIIKDGELIMPIKWNMDARDPEFAGGIRGKGMGEKDVMIICGAGDPNTAAISAISVALDLL